MIVDISFSAIGRDIPIDHGYALYSALSRILPDLHEAGWLAIHPIAGAPTGSGILRLSKEAHLQLRLPPERLPSVLPLAGKRIVINDDGKDFPVRLGVPEVYALKPAAVLHSRCVVIKVTEATKNKTQPNRETFLASVQAQLQEREIKGEITIDDRRDDKGRECGRRVVHIKNKIIVGYAVRVSRLSDEDSLKLQEVGLGGKLRMGCGIFVQ